MNKQGSPHFGLFYTHLMTHTHTLSLSLHVSPGEFPIYDSESLMKKKAHGSTENAVQDSLKWGCDRWGNQLYTSHNLLSEITESHFKRVVFILPHVAVPSACPTLLVYMLIILCDVYYMQRIG